MFGDDAGQAASSNPQPIIDSFPLPIKRLTVVDVLSYKLLINLSRSVLTHLMVKKLTTNPKSEKLRHVCPTTLYFFATLVTLHPSHMFTGKTTFIRVNSMIVLCIIDRYMFLCDDWLAVNKSDGSIRRTLKPSNAFTAANNSSALVRSNMFHKAVDGHMWLSVGMRAKPSSFTRAQRLATCMATLFLAMITNCMFFRTADEQTLNSETITLGPITLTPQQISNSLFSSLIVFPPVLIIVYFFSKSVPKSESSEEHQDDDSKRRTPCNPLLPYWCIYTTSTSL